MSHTGPRELDVHPQGGCGSGFGLVPGYTTLSVRVRANIKFGALKIKSVRTNERTVTKARVEKVCDHSQGVYFPPNRRRSIVFRVLLQQTNKQTKKQTKQTKKQRPGWVGDKPATPGGFLEVSGRYLLVLSPYFLSGGTYFWWDSFFL